MSLAHASSNSLICASITAASLEICSKLLRFELGLYILLCLLPETFLATSFLPPSADERRVFFFDLVCSEATGDEPLCAPLFSRKAKMIADVWVGRIACRMMSTLFVNLPVVLYLGLTRFNKSEEAAAT